MCKIYRIMHGGNYELHRYAFKNQYRLFNDNYFFRVTTIKIPAYRLTIIAQGMAGNKALYVASRLAYIAQEADERKVIEIS